MALDVGFFHVTFALPEHIQNVHKIGDESTEIEICSEKYRHWLSGSKEQ
jgi:hypothetical protein